MSHRRSIKTQSYFRSKLCNFQHRTVSKNTLPLFLKPYYFNIAKIIKAKMVCIAHKKREKETTELKQVELGWS